MPDNQVLEPSRFYIDCEFDGHGGPMLSFAMIREDGEGIHVRAMDVSATDPWVIENVVPLLDQHGAAWHHSVFTDNIGSVLRRFIGDVAAPVIVADSPVDIGRFCAAISTAPDGGWASTEYPLMTFEVHNVDCYPTDLPGAVQHNAWWDAMALRHKLATTPRHSSSAREQGRREGIEAAAKVALAEYPDEPGLTMLHGAGQRIAAAIRSSNPRPLGEEELASDEDIERIKRRIAAARMVLGMSMLQTRFADRDGEWSLSDLFNETERALVRALQGVRP